MNAGPGHNSAAETLKGLVSQIESLESDRAEINDQIKGVMAEAKGAGFDVKALRIVLRRRKMNPRDRDEQDKIVRLYEEDIGG